MKKIKIIKKKPAIAFSGSLIQQNFGEEYFNHGFLEWDLNTKKYQHKIVPNDVVYYTFYINNDSYPTEFVLPKFPHIRLVLNNSSKIKAEEFLLQLKSKYSVKSTVITYLNSDENINASNVSFIGDVSNVSYQSGLIIDYIKRTHQTNDNELFSTLEKINTEFNGALESEDLSITGRWKLKEMWFSNMYAFGDNNYINFETLSGVYSLYGENRTGKSSIIDIMLFALFDKASRAFKAIDMLNLDKDEFYVKLHFELAGIDYYIEKIGYKLNVDRVKVETNFWCEEDGEYRLLSGEQKNDTNSIIQTYVGTYENMILTSVSLQNNSFGIIDKSHSERKQLFSSFLGIDIFERLYNIANQENKRIESLIDELRKDKFSDQLYKIEKNLILNQEKLNQIITEISRLEVKKDELQNQIIDKNKLLERLSIGLIDIDTLEQKVQLISNDINTIKTTTNQLIKNLKIIVREGKKIRTQFQKFDLNLINKNLQELSILSIEQTDIENNIKLKNKDIEHQEKKLQQLDELEYDVNCSYCMNNIFVKDAIKTKEEHKQNLILQQELQNKLIVCLKKIEKLSKFTTQFEEYNKLKKSLDDLKNKYEKNKLQLESFQTKLELEKTNLKATKDAIRKYYKNQANIERNKLIEEEINLLKISMVELISDINYKIEIKTKLMSDITVAETMKRKIHLSIDKLKTYEERSKALKYYLDATHRDGVPYDLIKSVIPVFETEVNNILSQMVDFKLSIKYDDKNIEINFVRPDGKHQPIKTTSGMEKFVSAIAVRVALSKISNITKPNFIMIDEGLGNLDKKNLNLIPDLFEYLKMVYDFVIVISHIDAMKDTAANYMEIDTTRGYSHIYID